MNDAAHSQAFRDAAEAVASISIDDLPAASKVITCTVLGAVEVEDLHRLMAVKRAPAPEGVSAGDLTRIRERHHSVARLVASGLSQTLVASICGYTASYLSILLNNPSMMELVAFYRAQHTNAADAIAERLRTIGLQAVEKLAEGMEADELEAGDLLGLAKLGLDRSGHGPASKVHNVTEHHLLDHAELQRLNRAARAESREDILPAKVLPAPAQVDTGNADRGGSDDGGAP